MKKISILAVIAFFLASCGGGPEQKKSSNDPAAQETEDNDDNDDAPSYDPNRGDGKYSSSNITISDKLDPAMAEAGDKIQGVKCASCHKLSDEKLVGPGWKGVTQRRKPEWIMNFISNPDPMIDKDPAVQAQYELCLVRMPNQGLSEADTRNILEFMRKNDGVK